MIMPGRIWVAGIDIAGTNLLQNKCGLLSWRKGGQATFSAATKAEKAILHLGCRKWNLASQKQIPHQQRTPVRNDKIPKTTPVPE
jgi:hypothetical protein